MVAASRLKGAFTVRATFWLGRVAGVRIGVHWSVLLIFVLIALGLAEGRLPAAYPGHAPALYWAAGLATSVVFFGSLLAHELAHALVARRNRVKVENIVLWLLGGAARLKGEAETPGAELRIAGAGPLVSLLLGGIFGLAAWLLDAGAAPRLLIESVAWLAVINVLLAAFNSIPAAPLDGGRLLRAFLWWRSGDRLRATQGATAAGRVFGWLLVVVGVGLFVTRNSFGSLWLALIGWFLIGTATAESRQARVRALLADVPVRQAMSPDPMTVPAHTPVADVLTGPYRFRHPAYPVTDDDGAPLGLLVVGDARAVPVGQRETTTAAQKMIPVSDVLVAEPDDPLADLVPRMEPGDAHLVVVAQSGHVVGLLSASDVNRTVTDLADTALRRH